ncbi:MAG: barstar family protein [Solidesulfovibrio sp.]
MDIKLWEKVGRPCILLETGDVSSFDDLMVSLRDNKSRYVAIMRGNRMRTWENFMNEVAAALQFPWYFGENWGALNECINDLSWLNSDAYVLAITNSEYVLIDSTEKNRSVFGEMLVQTCKDWSLPADEGQWFGRPGRPFHVILHFGDMAATNTFGNIFDGEYKS